MLIKQSGSSVFAKMDLFGFDEFIPCFLALKLACLFLMRLLLKKEM